MTDSRDSDVPIHKPGAPSDEGRRTEAASHDTKYVVCVALRWMVDSASIEDTCRTLRELLDVEALVLGEVVDVRSDVRGNVLSYSVKLRGENAGVVSMTAQEAGSLTPLNRPARAKRYVIVLRYFEVRKAGSPAEAAALVRSAVSQWAASTVGEIIDQRIDPTSGRRILRMLQYSDGSKITLGGSTPV